MSEKVNWDDQKGIKVLKDKGYNLKFELDLNKKSVIDVIKLLDAEKIIDINISNVPLEDIITDIYRDVNKKWKNI